MAQPATGDGCARDSTELGSADEALDHRLARRGGSPTERIVEAVASRLFASRLYRYSLAGGVPSVLNPVPPPLTPGDGEIGRELLSGVFTLAGRQVVLTNATDPRQPWRPAGAGVDWLRAMHGFGWLRHLAAEGSPRAERLMRLMVRDWIAAHGRWSPLVWAPDVLGERLASWAVHRDVLWEREEPLRRRQLAGSFARQLRHLARCLPGGVRGLDLLVAIKGLILGALALPGGDRLARGLRLLATEIDRQVLPDGGHVERAPAIQFAVLRHLVEIRAALNAAGADCPEALRLGIDRMAPMLRFFRHGDGGLALFNDSGVGHAREIDRVLKAADAQGRAPAQAPFCGFQRLAAAKTVVICDTGSAPPEGYDGTAHAGTLAFEMSIGKERLIVNCGPAPRPSPAWIASARASAAHSTLCVDDTNSAEILPSGGLGKRPRMVTVTRQEDDTGLWIDASHDGYREAFGLVHRRRLFLARSGEDLRGEDVLTGPGGRGFALRFHLHPEVQAVEVKGGGSVLLRLASGAGFRLRIVGGAISLADSIYLGDGTLRRSQQVVCMGALNGSGVRLRWAVQREGGR